MQVFIQIMLVDIVLKNRYIYITYNDGSVITKNVFGKEKEKDKYDSKQVKCRFCPKCGKVELYIDLNSEE